MMTKGKIFLGVLPVISMLSPQLTTAKPEANNQAILQQLQQQQRQLNQQALQIKQLSAQVNTSPQANKHLSIKISTKAPWQKSVLSQASSSTNNILVPGSNYILGSAQHNLSISGMINALGMSVYDGKDTHQFFGSNPPASRLTIDDKILSSKTLSAGSRIQLGWLTSRTDSVSQITGSVRSSIDMRIAELYLRSKRFGKVSLGKGQTASENIAYSDFSGTMMLSRATVEDIGGGLFYRNASTNQLSNLTVDDSIDGLDGFGRALRLRYDTPSYHGFTLATSAIENEREDVALKYGQQLGNTRLAAQLGYTSPQTISTDFSEARGHVLNASVGILLADGLNLTSSVAELFAKEMGRKNPHYLYIKPGFRHAFFHTGLTAVSVDYGHFYNYAQNDDKANSYGAQLAQSFNRLHLVVYGGYRCYGLKRTGLKLDTLKLTLLGAAFKF